MIPTGQHVHAVLVSCETSFIPHLLQIPGHDLWEGCLFTAPNLRQNSPEIARALCAARRYVSGARCN